jgi:hypothetical protein
MNGKKAYVSPQVIRVKLEPSQAVLSQCAVDITATRNSNVSGSCVTGTHQCKQSSQAGDNAATS